VNPPLRKIFYWSARLLGIFLITIAVQMQLSGIHPTMTAGNMLLALLSRLWLPLALTAALVIAWRWEALGTALYLLIAGLSWLAAGKAGGIERVLLSASAVVTGVLFMISALMRPAQQKESRDTVSTRKEGK